MAAVVGATAHPHGEISQLSPSLFLGSARGVGNDDALLQLGISHAVNFADNLSDEHAHVATLYADQPTGIESVESESVPSVRRLSFPLPDEPPDDYHGEDQFITFLDTVLPQLQKLDGGGTVLHCVSGVNRSAAVAVALVMATERCSFRASLKWVSTQRPKAHPCTQFQLQLLRFEDKLQRQQSLSDADICLLEPDESETTCRLM
jgi:Dual specificity phosphatase, catalytic domain